MDTLQTRVTAEGKKQGISKGDKAFLHHLSLWDARRHLPHLRNLAAREFPDTPAKGLVIRIDYGMLPEQYSVIPINGYNGPETCGSTNAEARNDALFEKVRDNQEKYTLLESLIANGQDGQLVMTLCKSFWENDTGPLGSRFEGGEEYSDEDDGVDELMAQMTLNN